MKREQKIWLGAIIAFLICVTVYWCNTDNTSYEQAEYVSNFDGTALVDDNLITDSDRDTSASGALEIVIDASENRNWGDNAYYENKQLVICEGGSYIVSGRLEGPFVISVQDDEIVHLFLNGIEIYSTGAPAIWIKSASKVFITVSEGTENILCDSEYRSSDIEDGCIYSESDLTFNGKGTVNIRGYYQDAIASKGRIKIVDGNYSIYAVDDGIKGRDGVVIADGSIMLQTEGTGIKSTNTQNDKKGDIHIRGGEITLISGEYGVDSAKNLEVTNCNVSARTIYDNFTCEGEMILEEECVNEIDE